VFQNRVVHSLKINKSALVVLGGVIVAVGAAGVTLALHWPFSEKRITGSLQERFPATVTFQKFRATYFPHPRLCR
jgi:uncharacterized protein (DUF697 family)